MKDTIFRQAAIDVIEKIIPANPMLNDYTQGITVGAALAAEYIKQLPPAQSDIIRCKDCRYWERDTLRGGRRGKCNLTYIAVKGDYYCAVAQEKED